jgi:hypothetical protein
VTKGLTRFVCGLFAFVFVTGIAPAPASEPFPFGTALMLDAAPLRGSKRIPMIEIQENGMASIDLWCASARAQAIVGDNSITIAPGDLQSPQCDPERQSRMKNFWRPWRRSPIGGAMASLSNCWAQPRCVSV